MIKRLLLFCLLVCGGHVFGDTFSQTATEQYAGVGQPVWTISILTTLTVQPNDPAFPTFQASRTTSTVYTISGGGLGQTVGFVWQGSTFNLGNGVYPQVGKAASNLVTSLTLSNMQGDPGGFLNFTITSTSGSNTLTGAQPVIHVSMAQLASQLATGLPPAFLSSSGQVTLVAYQDGEAVQTSTFNPSTATGNLNINTTTSDPVTLTIQLAGYLYDNNGGYIHTGNIANVVDVPLALAQNGSTSASVNPLGGNVSVEVPEALYTEFPTNSVNAGNANGNNSNIGITNPIGYQPVWTNPSLVNGSYNITADPLSASIFKQGITNLEASQSTASLTLNNTLNTIATNTANLSGNGGGGGGNVTVSGGNITANVDLTPVVTAVNSVNSTVAGIGNIVTSNVTSNITASGQAGNVSSVESSIAGALPSAEFGYSTVPAGTATGLSFSWVMAGISYTADFDPADNTTLSSAMPYVKTAMSFFIVLGFFTWAWNELKTAIAQAAAMEQSHGNTIAMGTGGQATTLANALWISVGFVALAVAFGTLLTSAATTLLLGSLPANPFTGAPAQMMYLANFFLPLQLMLNVTVLRLLWNVASVPALVAVAVVKNFAVG